MTLKTFHFSGKKEKKGRTTNIVTIQILQYEFLGPIKLDEWGPPMEKVVYLILSRSKDSFNIVYAGECEKTDDKRFFLDNTNFKCWIQSCGSENSMYLAILPLFESDPVARKAIMQKITLRYKPACNPEEEIPPPDYVIKPKHSEIEKVKPSTSKISCPCCGGTMNIEKVLENTNILRCTGCGLSDTRTKL